MSNSPLVCHTALSPNHSGHRNQPITKITPHYMGGNCSIEVCGQILAPTSLLAIGIFVVCGVYGLMPVMASVVLITVFDCLCIAAAMPMQMTSSIMLQTGVEKEVLGRVSATLRMVSIASMAAGEMAFGLLSDATCVWLPIFVGAAGVGASSLLFRRIMAEQGHQA